jgi:hypothetical protein
MINKVLYVTLSIYIKRQLVKWGLLARECPTATARNAAKASASASKKESCYTRLANNQLRVHGLLSFQIGGAA